jgi:cytochrome P450
MSGSAVELERAGAGAAADRSAPVAGMPPGPGLPAVAEAALLAKWPVAFLESCRRRYGRCFTLTAPPLGRAVYIWEPRDVRALFRGDPEVFRVFQVRKAHRLVMGPNSLLLQDGRRHLRDRKLMTPRFHGAHLQRYRELVRAIADRELESWPVGEPFAMRPRLHTITLDMITRVVIGGDESRRARLRDALADLLEINPTLIVSVPAVRRDLGPRSPWGRFKRLRARVFDLLRDEIRRARESGSDSDGVLPTLVDAVDEQGNRMSDEWVLDELMTLLVAGQETTASALSWAFERLTHNPPVLERLVESVDAREEDYVEAVIHETLRARPIVAVTPRWLDVDSEVAGRRLPAGTVICIAQLLAQHNPESYPEPERFMPERFLGRSPDPMSFVAFGGGARRCVGASLALLEMSTVLRAVLERFELTAARRADERVTTHHVTLTPSRGAEVVIRRRNGG